MRTAVLSLVAVVALTAAAAAQQKPTPPPPTYEGMLLNTWKSLHTKILTMAKDLPEDKYDWKPHPDSRTMLDEFRHVTIGLEMSTAQLTGQKFDYNARIKADEGKPKTRDAMVKEMETALAASLDAVEKSPKPQLIFWVDHQGEHYGKLVSNYRMVGLVPPASRR
jgi:hypothetical protein